MLGAFLRRDDLDEYDRTAHDTQAAAMQRAIEFWEGEVATSGPMVSDGVYSETYELRAAALLPTEQHT